MTLMEELKERWKAIFLERESVEKRADELAENMQELEVALAALQSLHNPIADEQPELFDEPQEIEASSQSESCVPALGAETDLPTLPGGAEESRDQLCSVEGCEIHADDASEFAEEGYAPVTKPYRVIADVDYERVTYDFATMAEATASYDEFAAKPITRVDLYVLHEDGHGLQEWVKHSSFCKPASLVEAEQTREPVALAGEWVGMPDREHPAFNEPEPLADPIWNEPAPTKPEADAIAKAVDYYDPKAVAERNRFDPFRMFRRETEDA